MNNHGYHPLPLVAAASIRPPKNGHRASDADKLTRLVIAYERREYVRPVVVIESNFAGEQRRIALVGSHRIEAMRRVFRFGPIPDRYLIVIEDDMLASALPIELVAVLDHYIGDDEVAPQEYELLLRATKEASDALRDALGDQDC